MYTIANKVNVYILGITEISCISSFRVARETHALKSCANNSKGT